jgi:hypothetical protein
MRRRRQNLTKIKQGHIWNTVVRCLVKGSPAVAPRDPTNNLITCHKGKQGRQCTHKRDIKALSRKHYCRERAIIISYSEPVSVSLVMQHEMGMRCIIKSSMACPSVSYFRGKKLLNMKFVFWFSLNILSETFLILRLNVRDLIKSVHWPSCKSPVIPATF